MILLVALTLVLYGRDLSNSRGTFGDSFHHLINGIFLFDALHEPSRAVADPWAYGTVYYQHFPAISLGYYMPVFAMIEASLMLIFGVSPVTGQLAVLLMAGLMTFFAFKWFRLHFDHWWAVGATIALISTPILVCWGQDIMLEIPALAFVLGSMWLFERLLLNSDRPTWSAALAWASMTALAFWTKQHALMLLGVFVVSVVVTRRWDRLRNPAVLVSMALVAVAGASVVATALVIGGDVVGHSVGFTAQHVADRFNVAQWTYYLKRLPEIVGWPTLVLGVVGLWGAIVARDKRIWPALAWVAVFYLMHSFFKAQSHRYGCLWVPPFCLLAVMGVRYLPRFLVSARGSIGEKWPAVVGGLFLTAYAVSVFARGVQVRTDPVPSAYQRAADDLCDRLAPYTCLTFLPDRPGRMAVCFRLAVQERLGPQRDIYSFGRVLRAGQVFRHWQQRFPNLQDLAASVKDWNVRFILTETPRVLDPWAGDLEIAHVVDGLLATEEFRPVHTYPVRLNSSRHPERTLTLYERIEPVSFNANARPPIRTRRTLTSIGVGPDDDAP